MTPADTDSDEAEITTNSTVPVDNEIVPANNTATTPETNTTTGTNTTTTDPTTDGTTGGTTTNTTDTTEVDPALEESRQTCIATCTLKCKSEAAEKKDACIDLCFNQCTASIALVSTFPKHLHVNPNHFFIQYVQEKERPLLRAKQQALVSLSQIPESNYISYYDEPSD